MNWTINSDGSMTCPECGKSHGSLYEYDPNDYRKMTCPKCKKTSEHWNPSKELQEKINSGEFKLDAFGHYVRSGTR